MSKSEQVQELIAETNRLAQKCTQLTELNSQYYDDRKRLTAENVELKAALKPFAEFNAALKKWCAPDGYVLQEKRPEHVPVLRWREPTSPRFEDAATETITMLEVWPQEFERAEKVLADS